MGNSGNALLFLMPNEDTYIEFLDVRKVPIAEFDATEIDPNKNYDIFDKLQQAMLKERELYNMVSRKEKRKREREKREREKKEVVIQQYPFFPPMT
jgi:hypothetical protein